MKGATLTALFIELELLCGDCLLFEGLALILINLMADDSKFELVCETKLVFPWKSSKPRFQEFGVENVTFSKKPK